MIRALVDTDVILDFLLARPEFVEQATEVWKAHSEGKFEGYISAITPVNVFYVARRQKDAATARSVIERLVMNWRICAVDKTALENALKMEEMADFEDAVQQASAQPYGIELIVTRNLADYANSAIPALSPVNFLEHIQGE